MRLVRGEIASLVQCILMLDNIGLCLATASYFTWPRTLFPRIPIDIVLPGGYFLDNAKGVGAAGDDSAR
ncbi:hypothetical protein J27TS7_47450 [Paenibacillus dendritiformis]|nr:hypothetical protein J27TS7_47450 [Paenibacillus dendritiformis]